MNKRRDLVLNGTVAMGGLSKNARDRNGGDSEWGGKSLTRTLRHREQVACLRKDLSGRILSYLTTLVI